MCGIGGFIDRSGSLTAKQQERLTTSLLAGLDARGGDACGFAAITSDGEVVVQKAAVRAGEFNLGRRSLPSGTVAVLVHTRLATQGSEAWPENNHPLAFGHAVLVHNGVLWNDASLFDKHEREATAEVDSQALAMLLDYHGSGGVAKGLEKVSGSFAIAGIDTRDAPGTVIVARGESSPLSVLTTRAAHIFASTPDVVKLAWKAALGSVPRRKWRHLPEGTLGRLDRSGATFEAFKVRRTVWQYVTPAREDHRLTWAASSLAADACEVSARDSLYIAGGSGVWVPCPSCGDYVPAGELAYNWAGDDMCANCARDLAEEGIEATRIA